MYGASVSVGLQVFDAADIASIWMKIEQGCAHAAAQRRCTAVYDGNMYFASRIEARPLAYPIDHGFERSACSAQSFERHCVHQIEYSVPQPVVHRCAHLFFVAF
jgi:hypothetical protein